MSGLGIIPLIVFRKLLKAVFRKLLDLIQHVICKITFGRYGWHVVSGWNTKDWGGRVVLYVLVCVCYSIAINSLFQ